MGFQQRRRTEPGGTGTGPGRQNVPPHRQVQRDRGGHNDHGTQRTYMPKMQFPSFNGSNPGIWKDKCEDYFSIFNLPESM